MTACNSIPVVIDPNVALTRTEHVDGCSRSWCDCPQVDALCWKIGDAIHVHPDRYEQYFRQLERP
jgi:hypothetical protein